MRGVVFKNKSTKYFLLGGISVFFLIYLIWVISWSTQGEGLKKGQLGIDECHQCGMLLSDQRTVVSVLSTDSFGHSVTYHFDDVGCFLNYSSNHPQGKWIGISYDYETSQEIPLINTNFEQSNYRTPMGSGWISRKNPGPNTSNLVDSIKKQADHFQNK